MIQKLSKIIIVIFASGMLGECC